jgi:hypothetical protein
MLANCYNLCVREQLRLDFSWKHFFVLYYIIFILYYIMSRRRDKSLKLFNAFQILACK